MISLINRLATGAVVFERGPDGLWRFAPETPPLKGMRLWPDGRVFMPPGLWLLHHIGAGTMKAGSGGVSSEVPKTYLLRTAEEGYALPVGSDLETKLIIQKLAPPQS